MGRTSEYLTLIDRGRRAGLNTTELYVAMTALPPTGREQGPGQADANGYVSGYNPQGRRVYRPHGSYPRS